MITAKRTFIIMIMTMRAIITIPSITDTKPAKKFSRFVFTRASQETCSCAA